MYLPSCVAVSTSYVRCPTQCIPTTKEIVQEYLNYNRIYLCLPSCVEVSIHCNVQHNTCRNKRVSKRPEHNKTYLYVHCVKVTTDSYHG